MIQKKRLWLNSASLQAGLHLIENHYGIAANSGEIIQIIARKK